MRGSGPNGRILKSDVEEALSSGAQKPSGHKAAQFVAGPTDELYEDFPTSNIRRIIAERLSFSK